MTMIYKRAYPFSAPGIGAGMLCVVFHGQLAAYGIGDDVDPIRTALGGFATRRIIGKIVRGRKQGPSGVGCTSEFGTYKKVEATVDNLRTLFRFNRRADAPPCRSDPLSRRLAINRRSACD